MTPDRNANEHASIQSSGLTPKHPFPRALRQPRQRIRCESSMTTSLVPQPGETLSVQKCVGVVPPRRSHSVLVIAARVAAYLRCGSAPGTHRSRCRTAAARRASPNGHAGRHRQPKCGASRPPLPDQTLVRAYRRRFLPCESALMVSSAANRATCLPSTVYKTARATLVVFGG